MGPPAGQHPLLLLSPLSVACPDTAGHRRLWPGLALPSIPTSIFSGNGCPGFSSGTLLRREKWELPHRRQKALTQRQHLAGSRVTSPKTSELNFPLHALERGPVPCQRHGERLPFTWHSNTGWCCHLPTQPQGLLTQATPLSLRARGSIPSRLAPVPISASPGALASLPRNTVHAACPSGLQASAH